MIPEDDPQKWDFLPELTETYEKLTPNLNKKVPTMPWIKYINILEKLKELIKELKEFGPPPKPGLLETVMINWLKDVAPEKVTPRNMKAIHEFACAIGDKVGEVKGLSAGVKFGIGSEGGKGGLGGEVECIC